MCRLHFMFYMCEQCKCPLQEWLPCFSIVSGNLGHGCIMSSAYCMRTCLVSSLSMPVAWCCVYMVFVLLNMVRCGHGGGYIVFMFLGVIWLGVSNFSQCFLWHGVKVVVSSLHFCLPMWTSVCMAVIFHMQACTCCWLVFVYVHDIKACWDYACISFRVLDVCLLISFVISVLLYLWSKWFFCNSSRAMKCRSLKKGKGRGAVRRLQSDYALHLEIMHDQLGTLQREFATMKQLLVSTCDREFCSMQNLISFMQRVLVNSHGWKKLCAKGKLPMKDGVVEDPFHENLSDDIHHEASLQISLRCDEVAPLGGSKRFWFVRFKVLAVNDFFTSCHFSFVGMKFFCDSVNHFLCCWGICVSM